MLSTLPSVEYISGFWKRQNKMIAVGRKGDEGQGCKCKNKRAVKDKWRIQGDMKRGTDEA